MAAHEEQKAGAMKSARQSALAGMRSAEAMVVALVEKRPWLGAMLAHLLFAMLLFSPFFLQGKIIVGSTDNYFGTWVNYLFSRTTLAAGDLGTWNPNVLGGIDFTASPHNHMAGPLDWPLFLLPESWFLSGLTIQIFLLVWVCGVFSYLFFREELGNAKWAFFASILYQAGGYTFFSITTYSNTQLHAVSALMLYLIWSADRRHPVVSYAIWTLGLATIILSANPLYSFAGFALILTLFAYRWWPGSLAIWRRQSPVLWFYAAAFTAVTLTAVHWLPITHSLVFAGSRMNSFGLRSEWGNTYLGLGAFVPEIFGVHFTDSTPMLQALGSGGHAQFHGYPFFGVVGALLVVLALRFKIPGTKFWAAFLLFSTVWLLACPPFSALIDLLMLPVVHHIIPKLMIPVAFSVVAARAAMYLECNWDRMTVRVSALLLATMGVVVVLGITVWAFSHSVASRSDDAQIAAFHKMSVMGAKVAALVCIGLIAVAGCLVLRSAGGKGWSIWLLWIAVPVALFAFFLMGFAHFGDADRLNHHPFFKSAFGFLAIAAGAGMLAAAAFTACERGWLTRTVALRIFAVLIVGTAVAVLWPSLASGALRPGQSTMLMAVGMFKFAVLGSGVVYLLTSLARRPDLRPLLFPGLCALLVVDLLPYNKNYTRQITEAFVYAEKLYPDRSKLVGDAIALAHGDNLLRNDSFEDWTEDATPEPLGWVVNGPALKAAPHSRELVCGQRSAAVVNGNANGSLQQEVLAGQNLGGRRFSFGVWIKADSVSSVRLYLTDGSVGCSSPYNAVAGEWVWLHTTVDATRAARHIRPQVQLKPRSQALVDGAILVEGGGIDPEAVFGKDAAHARAPGFHGTVPKELRIDPRHYRVNNPHLALKLAPLEIEANIPSIYGVRSYGGVNSDVPKGLVHLIHRFEPRGTAMSGVWAHYKHPTLLDLLGCGYDVDGSGELVERPTALSRFMLFHHFEVVDDGKVLDRLAAPDFVARDRLLLEADPGLGAATVDHAPEPMDYASPRTSELLVHCKCEAPALLFFGDNYHPDWEAFVDGRRQPVLRADANFMAVAVPAGTSTVEFRFRPRMFEAGMAISGISLAGFLVALPVAGWLRRRRHAVPGTAVRVPVEPQRFAA